MHGISQRHTYARRPSHIITRCMITPRRELFLKDIQALSDKKLMLLLHRARRCVSHHRHIIGCPLCCRPTCIPSYMICSQPSVPLAVCRPSAGP